jgi:hypothetical protein
MENILLLKEILSSPMVKELLLWEMEVPTKENQIVDDEESNYFLNTIKPLFFSVFLL